MLANQSGPRIPQRALPRKKNVQTRIQTQPLQPPLLSFRPFSRHNLDQGVTASQDAQPDTSVLSTVSSLDSRFDLSFDTTFVPRDLSRLTHLTELDLSKTNLGFIPAELENLLLLQVLDLSHNSVSSVMIQSSESFLALAPSQSLKVNASTRMINLPPSLKLLDLSYNFIQSLPRDFFRATPALVTLNLQYNFAPLLPSLPPTLESLDLRRLPIKYLPAPLPSRLTTLSLDSQTLVHPPRDIYEFGIEAVREYLAGMETGETDVERCRVFGEGVSSKVVAGSTTQFFIKTFAFNGQMKCVGGDDISVKIFRALDVDVEPAVVIDLDDGTYRVQMDLTIAGTYDLAIKVNGISLRNYSIVVVPGRIDFEASTFTMDADAARNVIAGTASVIKIHARDKYGQMILPRRHSFVLELNPPPTSSPSSLQTVVEESETEDGIFACRFIITQAGIYLPTISLDGQPLQRIFEGPLTVHPATVSLQHSFISLDSIEPMIFLQDKQCQFWIEFRDRFGNFVRDDHKRSLSGLVIKVNGKRVPFQIQKDEGYGQSMWKCRIKDVGSVQDQNEVTFELEGAPLAGTDACIETRRIQSVLCGTVRGESSGKVLSAGIFEEVERLSGRMSSLVERLRREQSCKSEIQENL